ncbi:MAG: glycosyltransferase family 1 protein [Frankiales bacterium]|nr:glycosyltransferase family 1 protein [Frankiales bacterium]
MLPNAAAQIPRTIVLTGHFPPASGGVQSFTWELLRRLPAERMLVIAPNHPEAAAFDATLSFRVVRRGGYLLFRGLRGLVADFGAEVVWLPALAPFGMYLPLISHSGVGRIVGSTHGQEIGWVRAWPTRLALRAAVRRADTVTYLTTATETALKPILSAARHVAQLAGGVDAAVFADADASIVRARHGLGADPVVLSVARLVRRKGQDRLIEAWPSVLAEVPRARLLLVGDGPMRAQLTAAAAPFDGSVVVTGPVSEQDLPRYLAAADVFASPSRDDRHGLQTEGLGLSTLEASASGVPVVVGDSGGSSRSLIDGVTGLLVDARTAAPLASALIALLSDPARAAAMGAAGRDWVAANWTWDASAARLAAVLRADPAVVRTSMVTR